MDTCKTTKCSVHLNREAWMWSPLSAGCVNTAKSDYHCSLKPDQTQEIIFVWLYVVQYFSLCHNFTL